MESNANFSKFSNSYECETVETNGCLIRMEQINEASWFKCRKTDLKLSFNSTSKVDPSAVKIDQSTLYRFYDLKKQKN
jgi:hypothetical protein